MKFNTIRTAEVTIENRDIEAFIAKSLKENGIVAGPSIRLTEKRDSETGVYLAHLSWTHASSRHGNSTSRGETSVTVLQKEFVEGLFAHIRQTEPGFYLPAAEEIMDMEATDFTTNRITVALNLTPVTKAA